MPEVIVVDGVPVTPAMIDRAERSIRLACRTAVYAVDLTGTPTDTLILGALQEATLMQIRALMAAQRESDAVAAGAALSPLGRPLSSASLAGATYTADPSGTSTPVELRIDASGLCRAAYEVLLDAGLLGGGVVAYG